MMEGLQRALPRCKAPYGWHGPGAQERPLSICCRAWNPRRGDSLEQPCLCVPLAHLENVNPCRHRGLVKSQRSALARHKFQLFSVCKLLLVQTTLSNTLQSWQSCRNTRGFRWNNEMALIAYMYVCVCVCIFWLFSKYQL